MARVQNTLIGKSSGSVGGATFSTWKGVNVLKSKAVDVANPNTVPQQTQRNRMTLIVSIYRIIAAAISVGYKPQAVKKSEYNAFVQDNIESALAASVPPTVTLSPADLKLSKGTIQALPLTTLSGTNASADVDFTYPMDIPVGGSSLDPAYAVVYNATQDLWGVNALGTKTRNDGDITVTMSAAVVTADVLHGYLFFKSATSNEVSDSVYGTDTV